MKEKDWILLKTLQEEKNITRASARLFISQPALTYRLKQLEEEFKTTIIYRKKKGIEFTPEGEYLVNYSIKMLKELSSLKDQITKMENKIQGQIRLGVSSNFARYELPEILKNFNEHYPSVEFNVRTGWSSTAFQMIQKEEVHLAIIRGDQNWGYEKKLLTLEPLKIVSTKPIILSELPKLGMIHYKTDTHLRTQIEKWWQSHFSVPPLINMEVDRIDTCFEMVKNSLGYGIFPSISLKNQKDLFMEEITDPKGHPILRETWLFYREHSLELPTIKAFVNFLESQISIHSIP